MSKIIDKKINSVIKEIDSDLTFREFIFNAENFLKMAHENLDKLEDYEIEYYFNMLLSLINE